MVLYYKTNLIMQYAAKVGSSNKAKLYFSWENKYLWNKIFQNLQE
jgi:hypothetical protein